MSQLLNKTNVNIQTLQYNNTVFVSSLNKVWSLVHDLHLDMIKQTEALRCVPAFSVAHWEQLQQEKQEQERRFEAELQGLRAQQQRELGALEERLKAQHAAEAEILQAEQRRELEELRFKQQEQVPVLQNCCLLKT